MKAPCNKILREYTQWSNIEDGVFLDILIKILNG